MEERRPPRMLVALEPRHGMQMLVRWSTGETQAVDLAPVILSRRQMVPLRRDGALFSQATIAEDGRRVVWPGGVGLSVADIENQIDPPVDNARFREVMSICGLSLDGMTARLGISRRMVAAYRDKQPIPRVIGLAVLQLGSHTATRNVAGAPQTAERSPDNA